MPKTPVLHRFTFDIPATSAIRPYECLAPTKSEARAIAKRHFGIPKRGVRLVEVKNRSSARNPGHATIWRPRVMNGRLPLGTVVRRVGVSA